MRVPSTKPSPPDGAAHESRLLGFWDTNWDTSGDTGSPLYATSSLGEGRGLGGDTGRAGCPWLGVQLNANLITENALTCLHGGPGESHAPMGAAAAKPRSPALPPPPAAQLSPFSAPSCHLKTDTRRGAARPEATDRTQTICKGTLGWGRALPGGTQHPPGGELEGAASTCARCPRPSWHSPVSTRVGAAPPPQAAPSPPAPGGMGSPLCVPPLPGLAAGHTEPPRGALATPG